jgi:hypothetical protein
LIPLLVAPRLHGSGACSAPRSTAFRNSLLKVFFESFPSLSRFFVRYVTR